MSQTKAKALYAFDGDTSAGELSFREGELVTVVRQDVGDGWWEVMAMSGKRGLAPGAYLQLVANAAPPPPPPSTRPRAPPPPVATLPSRQSFNANADDTYRNSVSSGPTMRTARPTNDASGLQSQKLNSAWSASASVSDADAAQRRSTFTSDRSSTAAAQPGRNTAVVQNDDSFEDDSFDENDSDYDRLNTEEARAGETGETGSSGGTLSTRMSTASGMAEMAKSGTLRRGLCRTFVKLGGEAYLLGQFENVKLGDAEHFQLVETPQGLVMWRSPGQSMVVQITAPRKTTKLRGLKTYTAYQLVASNSGLQVSRRYKQFDWLLSRLREKYVFVCVPPLPDKQLTGLYEEEFIKTRMKKLQLWINRVTRHPLLNQSEVLSHFVTCTDDKRWKVGKRKAEKDDVQGGRMFNGVDLSGMPSLSGANGKANFDVTSSETAMDAFDEQVRALDSACKQLNSVLHTSAKQQTATANRVAKPLADAISQLGRVGFDPNSGRVVPGTDKMQMALAKTSATFNDIAKMYTEQPAKDIEPFIDSLVEYHGLLTQLPELTLLHRNTTTAVHECTYQYNNEQKLSEEDFSKICQRARVITTVVEAEVNFFNSEKVQDFKDIMRGYLQQQANFHREIAAKLEAALREFS